MQISRHWRLNPQRYRLQGVRLEDGSVSLQKRPATIGQVTIETTQTSLQDQSLRATVIRQA